MTGVSASAGKILPQLSPLADSGGQKFQGLIARLPAPHAQSHKKSGDAHHKGKSKGKHHPGSRSQKHTGSTSRAGSHTPNHDSDLKHRYGKTSGRDSKSESQSKPHHGEKKVEHPRAGSKTHKSHQPSSITVRTRADHQEQAGSLPPKMSSAVDLCVSKIKVFTRPGPEPKEQTNRNIRIRDLPSDFSSWSPAKQSAYSAFRKLGVEDVTNSGIYTQDNYNKEIKRGQDIISKIVDSWTDIDPAEKQKTKLLLQAIVEGTAGMETGWSVNSVIAGANQRPHTGIYQTSWAYLHDAADLYRKNSQVSASLSNEEKLLMDFALKNGKTLHGAPTTSFTGQGAAVAAMLALSYRRHMNDLSAGKVNVPYSGTIFYMQHMLGNKGSKSLLYALKNGEAGNYGVSKSVYNSNFLILSNPQAGLNDLNPQRLIYENSTPRATYRMFRDKLVHAYNRLVDRAKEDSSVNQKADTFARAFFPEWVGNSRLMDRDTQRVRFQKEQGIKRRDDIGDAVRDLPSNVKVKSNLQYRRAVCETLQPLPAYSGKR